MLAIRQRVLPFFIGLNQMTVFIVLLLVQAAGKPGNDDGCHVDPRREDGHPRVGVVEHADGDQDQEQDAEVVRIRIERRFKFVLGHDFRAPSLAEILLGISQDEPGDHAREDGSAV